MVYEAFQSCLGGLVLDKPESSVPSSTKHLLTFTHICLLQQDFVCLADRWAEQSLSLSKPAFAGQMAKPKSLGLTLNLQLCGGVVWSLFRVLFWGFFI